MKSILDIVSLDECDYILWNRIEFHSVYMCNWKSIRKQNKSVFEGK